MMCISMLEWPNVYYYRWMTEYLDAVSHFGAKIPILHVYGFNNLNMLVTLYLQNYIW